MTDLQDQPRIWETKNPRLDDQAAALTRVLYGRLPNRGCMKSIPDGAAGAYAFFGGRASEPRSCGCPHRDRIKISHRPPVTKMTPENGGGSFSLSRIPPPRLLGGGQIGVNLADQAVNILIEFLQFLRIEGGTSRLDPRWM